MADLDKKVWRTTRTLTVGEDGSVMICHVKTLRDAQFLAVRLGTLPLDKQAVIITQEKDIHGNHYAIHHGSLETPGVLAKTVLVSGGDEPVEVTNPVGTVYTFGYDEKALPVREEKQLKEAGMVPLFSDGGVGAVDPRFE